jgi:two-component system, sensor histidine kinase YesM
MKWPPFPRKALENFRGANLRKKLIVLISFSMAAVLVYSFVVLFVTSYANTRKDTEEYLQSSLALKKRQLASYLSRLDYTAYSIMFSNWVQRLMVIDRTASKAEFQDYQKNVMHFLSSLSTINDDLSFVLISDGATLWSNNNIRHDQKYDIRKQPWFNELREKKKYIEYGRSVLFSGLNDRWSMTIYYTVTSYFNFSFLGYLAINVTADNLNFLMPDSATNARDLVRIRDSKGRTILSNVPPSLETDLAARLPSGMGMARRGGWYSLTDTLMDGLWTIRIFRKQSPNPFVSLGNMNLIFLLPIPISILFIMSIAAFSRYLTNPIIKCKNAMMEIRRNHFGLTVENNYKDEIGELLSGFNDMSVDLALLMKQNEEINALRREAEIDILQQKVNPHFLYNTLEIINGLIIGGKGEEAVQVCEILGKIYHYNLMKSKWVSLRDECEYIRQYLSIVKHKISRLDVYWDIDEAALSTEICKLTLQPLVENAVLHGFRANADDACLTIAIRSVEDGTEVVVMDNGSGMANDDLAAIEQNLEAVQNGGQLDGSHIGISNVYQRLYLEYQKALRFTIESRELYGTRVSLVVPKSRPAQYDI